MLVPHDEIRSSLRGALRILFKDPKALSYFNMTPQGFLHSFQAIWIAIIPFMFSLLNQRQWMMSVNELSLGDFPSAAFFSIKILGIGLEWAVMPIILWLAADLLDIKTRYGSFIIARNWASIVMAWIFFIPTLTHMAGLIILEVMVFTHLILLGVVVIYGYRIARMTLEKPPLFCMALIFADLILGMIMGEMLWSLVEPMMVASPQ